MMSAMSDAQCNEKTEQSFSYTAETDLLDNTTSTEWKEQTTMELLLAMICTHLTCFLSTVNELKMFIFQRGKHITLYSSKKPQPTEDFHFMYLMKWAAIQENYHSSYSGISSQKSS